MTSLKDKIAVVAGGTRGAGRAIAIKLGEAGATVYVTGRTTREKASPMQRKETMALSRTGATTLISLCQFIA